MIDPADREKHRPQALILNEKKLAIRNKDTKLLVKWTQRWAQAHDRAVSSGASPCGARFRGHAATIVTTDKDRSQKLSLSRSANNSLSPLKVRSMVRKSGAPASGTNSNCSYSAVAEKGQDHKAAPTTNNNTRDPAVVRSAGVSSSFPNSSSSSMGPNTHPGSTSSSHQRSASSGGQFPKGATNGEKKPIPVSSAPSFSSAPSTGGAADHYSSNLAWQQSSSENPLNSSSGSNRGRKRSDSARSLPSARAHGRKDPPKPSVVDEHCVHILQVQFNFEICNYHDFVSSTQQPLQSTLI